ncbi:MAG: hypothetical protein AAF495_20090 [Pseudomonadota bacterium]
MLGFSLQKILLLVAIISAVWYGFKLVSRMQEARDGTTRQKRTSAWRKPDFIKRATGRPTAKDEPEDMVQCPTCKSYVAARGVQNCGRADCPY